MINQELERLYKSNRSNLTDLFDEDEIDGAILMHCWEEDYNSSDYKILFIGKEPNGWKVSFTDDIDLLLEKYRRFGLCTEEGGSNRNSNFWKCVYEFNSRLNPTCEGKKNFMWTNVSKCCTCKGKKLDWETHKKLVTNFNVLSDEIRMLNPDVVIFFTGTTEYDDKIKIQFSDKLEIKQVVEHIPSNELARLENDNLPHFTYRLYHPEYMYRFNLATKIHLDIIEKEIKIASTKA